MVRGVFIRRTTHEHTTVADALGRYEREVVLKASTQTREGAHIREVKAFFGKYSLVAYRLTCWPSSATSVWPRAKPITPSAWNWPCWATFSAPPSGNGTWG